MSRDLFEVHERLSYYLQASVISNVLRTSVQLDRSIALLHGRRDLSVVYLPSKAYARNADDDFSPAFSVHNRFLISFLPSFALPLISLRFPLLQSPINPFAPARSISGPAVYTKRSTSQFLRPNISEDLSFSSRF